MIEGRRSRDRLRFVPEADQKDSDFLALPSSLPINCYDPDFFNAQQPCTRNRIAIPKIALLPDVTRSFTGEADERLSDEKFMGKYGEAVLSRYNLDDLDAFGDEEDWIEDNDEMDEDYEGEEDPESTGQRTNLVVRLSSESI